MRPRLLMLAAPLTVWAVIGMGCGADDEDATDTTAADTTSPAATAVDPAAVDTGAAELRAGLTSILQEHVYLAGLTLSTAASSGLDSPATAAAVAALDTNSTALADAVGSVYGAPAGDQFLELWKKHIQFFVDYTVAKLGGDTAGADGARTALDGYRQDFGAFLSSANPNLTTEAVAEALVPHITSVFAAVDSLVANDGQVFANLRTAAQEMPAIAQVLAGAIAAQFPDMFSGAVDAGGAELRATLTNILQEHVYLAGLTLSTAASSGLDSPATAAAVAALDTNSTALADAVGSVYGAPAGDQFLELWKKHIQFFVDYTVAKLGGDTAGADGARTALDGYRQDFGAFLSSANPNLTTEAVAEALVPHITSVFAAVDSLVANDGQVFANLRTAAQEMPAIAQVLAGAITAQFPDMFGG